MYNVNKQQLIDFENKIADLFEAGELPYLIHLSGGNEDELIEIFKEIQPGDYIFSTHRSHYHYLLAGGSATKLEELIHDGNSMFVFDQELNFLTSSVLAGTAGIAAGVALALKLKGNCQRVWCFVGDGAEDEGHFYEAVMFVEGHNLPCVFIIEDNDRSVVANKRERRGDYDPVWPACVRRYNYRATFPHGGTGTKKFITFKDKKNG